MRVHADLLERDDFEEIAERADVRVLEIKLDPWGEFPQRRQTWALQLQEDYPTGGGNLTWDHAGWFMHETFLVDATAIIYSPGHGTVLGLNDFVARTGGRFANFDSTHIHDHHAFLLREERHDYVRSECACGAECVEFATQLKPMPGGFMDPTDIRSVDAWLDAAPVGV